MEADGALPRGEVELLSYHSVSKGFYGECGRRGGYVEIVNVDEDAIEDARDGHSPKEDVRLPLPLLAHKSS